MKFFPSLRNYFCKDTYFLLILQVFFGGINIIKYLCIKLSLNDQSQCHITYL